jgi:hypothetical protein
VPHSCVSMSGDSLFSALSLRLGLIFSSDQIGPLSRDVSTLYHSIRMIPNK